MTTVLNAAGVDKDRFVDYTEKNPATYKVRFNGSSIVKPLETPRKKTYSILNNTCFRTGLVPGTRRPRGRRIA